MTKSLHKYKRWECGTCNKLLGMLYPTGVLAIKHKEFYCWITGTCKIICRFCSTQNTINTLSSFEDVTDFDKDS